MTIIRNIFFSNTKVTSGYRYGNDFALVPITGIETLQDFAQWYPCVIEVRCEEPEIDKSVDDYELLRSRALSEIYSRAG